MEIYLHLVRTKKGNVAAGADFIPKGGKGFISAKDFGAVALGRAQYRAISWALEVAKEQREDGIVLYVSWACFEGLDDPDLATFRTQIHTTVELLSAKIKRGKGLRLGKVVEKCLALLNPKKRDEGENPGIYNFKGTTSPVGSRSQRAARGGQ